MKLGLAVAWPAFWTGIPIKFVIVLLLLAMGLHPWETQSLIVLLVLSIPIDIWALSLSTRTVFLDRLRVEPSGSLGLTLWWQAALFSAGYLPIAYFIESQTVAVAKSITAGIMETEPLKSLPVPERISIELSLWGTVAIVMLLGLALGWLFVFGRLVRRQVTTATPATVPYQALVRRWDLLRVPADQPLALTLFLVAGVGLILALWAAMPVTTPHPHELYIMEPVKVKPQLKPTEALEKTEKAIEQAEAAIQALETKADEESKRKEKSKGKGGGKEAVKPKAAGEKAGSTKPSSAKADPIRMMGISTGALAQRGGLP